MGGELNLRLYMHKPWTQTLGWGRPGAVQGLRRGEGRKSRGQL